MVVALPGSKEQRRHSGGTDRIRTQPDSQQQKGAKRKTPAAIEHLVVYAISFRTHCERSQ
jgi:hypothetical protein